VSSRPDAGTAVRDEAGFTLVEVLVVIAVIAILASVVSPMVFRNVGDAKQASARSQMEIFALALDAFRLDSGRYPSTDEGLDALRHPPAEAEGWRGPYLRKEVPTDPWRRVYIYKAPGVVNPESYDLLSLGKDGKEGGDNEDADIEAWR
jgi:general secretion pathway protein G